MDYPSRLTVLNIDSLEKRRLQADLIFAFKIIFGLVDIVTHEVGIILRDGIMD